MANFKNQTSLKNKHLTSTPVPGFKRFTDMLSGKKEITLPQALQEAPEDDLETAGDYYIEKPRIGKMEFALCAAVAAVLIYFGYSMNPVFNQPNYDWLKTHLKVEGAPEIGKKLVSFEKAQRQEDDYMIELIWADMKKDLAKKTEETAEAQPSGQVIADVRR